MISCLVSDDHSRVKLENSENDYINASLVDVEEAQRAYILSQVCRLQDKQCTLNCLHGYLLNTSACHSKENTQDLSLTFW